MQSTQIDIWQLIWGAGFVTKITLGLLLLASGLCWAVIFKKRKLIREIQAANDEFLYIFRKADSLAAVMDMSQNVQDALFYKMFSKGFQELQKLQNKVRAAEVGASSSEGIKKHFAQFGLGMIERALQQGINEANIKLESFLPTLATIGATGPFIGLFGTVWGIINAFSGLSTSGGATLEAVAPGMAEALITTALGLVAAIPAVVFYNHYNHVISKFNIQMESFGQEFLNKIELTMISSSSNNGASNFSGMNSGR